MSKAKRRIDKLEGQVKVIVGDAIPYSQWIEIRTILVKALAPFPEARAAAAAALLEIEGDGKDGPAE